MVEKSEGMQRRRRAQGKKANQLAEVLVSLDPQIAEWADSFIFGEVWGRDGLSQDDRMLVAIVAAGRHRAHGSAA